MSDILTPSERAAIAAYPEDRVQRIARGVSSWGYTFDPNHPGSDADKLRSSKPIGWREQITAQNLAFKRDRHNRKRKAAVYARQQIVRAFRAEGKTLDQMAAHLGVSVATIKADLLAIRRASE